MKYIHGFSALITSFLALQGCSAPIEEAASAESDAEISSASELALDQLLFDLLPGPAAPVDFGAGGFEKRATVTCAPTGFVRELAIVRCQAAGGGSVFGPDASRVLAFLDVPGEAVDFGVRKISDVRCRKFLDGSLRCDSSLPQPASARFARDDRPVDGELTELELTRSGRGYDVTLRTAFFDRIAHREVDTTKTLSRDLDCTFAAESIVCSRDDRPVDGDLVEISLKVDRHGTWEATHRSAFYDLFTHTQHDETREIARRLERR